MAARARGVSKPEEPGDGVTASAESDETTETTETTEPKPPAERERGLLHYIGLGLSGGLLGLMVLLALMVIVIPAVAQATPLTVLTSSMEPTYPPGTLIVIRDVDIDEIAVGDVVTYQLKSGEPEVVTHRVVERQLNADDEIVLILKGDNNDIADEPVREVQVRGKLWYAIPVIGWVNNLITGESRGIIVPVIAGLLFVYAAWTVVSSLRDRAKKRRAAAGV